jgi:tetratricopeptide (TPR) repeat protein
MRSLFVLLLLSLVSLGLAQEGSQDNNPHIVPRNMPQPKEQPTPAQAGDSSSKDSGTILEDASSASSGNNSSGHSTAGSTVTEMRPYDPHKAAKDVEVGVYYLKRKNYRAALDRLNEALLYKPNDADATFYLAETQEKLELYALAYQNYRNYLNIITGGPYAKDAQEGIKRLEPHVPKDGSSGQPASNLTLFVQQGEDYLARNDFESAYTSFSKALEIAPDDPVSNFRFAESLQGLQRLDAARTYYKKYLNLQPNGNMAGDAKRQIAQINLTLGKP